MIKAVLYLGEGFVELVISILIFRHLRKPKIPGGRRTDRVFNEAGPEARPAALGSRFALHPDPGVQGHKPRFTREGPHRVEVHLQYPGELQHQLGE